MEVEHSSFPKIKKKVQLSPISCPKKYFSPPHHFYPVVLFLLLRCLLGSSRKFFHRKRKAAWQTNVLTPAFRRPERSGYHTGSREICQILVNHWRCIFRLCKITKECDFNFIHLFCNKMFHVEVLQSKFALLTCDPVGCVLQRVFSVFCGTWSTRECGVKTS